MSPVRRGRRAQCPGCEQEVWVVRDRYEEHDADRHGNDCDWGGTPVYLDDDEENGR